MTTTTAGAAEVTMRAGVRPRVRSRFYVGLSAIMAGIVIVGFWPSYFGPMLAGNIARPAVIQAHGLIFVGWMVLLMAQVILAARGQVRQHRAVGRYGIAYGWLVLVMGLVVGPAASVMHVRAGEWTLDRGAGFLLVTFGDMVLFGACFVAAVAYRSRPEVHKRLMVAATVALLFAAVGRMAFIQSQFLAVVVWLSPLLVGMGYDWLTRRRVHTVYIITTVGFFIGALRVLVAETEAWLWLGRPLLESLL